MKNKESNKKPEFPMNVNCAFSVNLVCGGKVDLLSRSAIQHSVFGQVFVDASFVKCESVSFHTNDAKVRND